MEVDIQTQIHIIVGVFGGAIIILIIWVAALCYMFDRLKRQVNENVAPPPPPAITTANNHHQTSGHSNYAYNHSDIKPGEELSRRGYAIYEGPVVAPRLQRFESFSNSVFENFIYLFVRSTGNGMYGAAPRSYVSPVAAPAVDYAIPDDNDDDDNGMMGGTKDASNDFSDYRPKNNKNRVPAPPVVADMSYGQSKRPSQFNSNIILGPAASSASTFIDDSSDGGADQRRPTQYYNNRAMNY